MEKYKFRSSRNDLFCDTDLKCDCLQFPNDPGLSFCKKPVKLTGYSDGNFFDNVNKQPNSYRCECGSVVTYQWFRDGAEVSITK